MVSSYLSQIVFEDIDRHHLITEQYFSRTVSGILGGQMDQISVDSLYFLAIRICYHGISHKALQLIVPSIAMFAMWISRRLFLILKYSFVIFFKLSDNEIKKITAILLIISSSYSFHYQIRNFYREL